MNERQSTVFEVSDFGVKVRHQNGKTSTIQENVCMPAVEWCSIQARKLNALTLMTCANGFEVFDELGEQSKSDLLWLMNDLSSEVAALAQLAVEVEASRSTSS
ncbi:hypothetical protein L3V59_11055 [Burkholderia aenigmatica]|uniref:hypothetical protein n=1 Tax=Burkholderia aenigmatica TaxID=2015348 RepID=UPI001F2393B3|nr:hypothetical protein [Burkholderia aenigmatica]UKD10245.1 hypothetical protein L3V59_11055 [Burkholderia aenigmatica]